MNPQQLQDELAALVGIEHALVVDNLQISYALGTDREDAETPLGPPSPEGREAAGRAQGIAINDMRHLKAIHGLLLRAGGRPGLGRAAAVQPPSGPAIPLGSVSPASFAAFGDRQRAIASAADGRAAALSAALPTVDPPIDPDLRQRLEATLGLMSEHAGAVEQLVTTLGTNPEHHLRATRTTPETDAERALVVVSDRWYQTLVAMVTGWLAHDELDLDLSGRAQSAMFDLDAFNAVLVTRGLIAPFHL